MSGWHCWAKHLVCYNRFRVASRIDFTSGQISRPILVSDRRKPDYSIRPVVMVIGLPPSGNTIMLDGLVIQLCRLFFQDSLYSCLNATRHSKCLASLNTNKLHQDIDRPPIIFTYARRNKRENGLNKEAVQADEWLWGSSNPLLFFRERVGTCQ